MEEIEQTLIELGLTGLQAKVIIALQNFDYATVKEISREADVYRQQVYPVLDDLQNMGLVRKRLDHPNKYNSPSLNEIFTILLDRKGELLAALKKKTRILQCEIPQTLKNTDEEEFVFELITGRERIKREIHKQMENAHKIDLILKFDPLFYLIADKLEAERIEHKENVEVRVLTGTRPKNIHRKKIPKDYKIRFVDSNFPVEIVVCDNRANLTLHSNRNDLNLTCLALLTSNHPCFVEMLNHYFEVLWKASKKIPQEI